MATGDLVNAFKEAQHSIALVEHAKASAARSEEKTLSGLNSLKSLDASYTKPSDVPENIRENLSFESLNAHFQKIQAVQVEAHNQEKLNQESKNLESKYAGKKVTISVLGSKTKPIAVGLKPKYGAGRYYTSSSSKKIKAIITGIDLVKNVITLKPTAPVRLFNSSVKSYKVFVINPYNLEPLVAIS